MINLASTGLGRRRGEERGAVPVHARARHRRGRFPAASTSSMSTPAPLRRHTAVRTAIPHSGRLTSRRGTPPHHRGPDASVRTRRTEPEATTLYRGQPPGWTVYAAGMTWVLHARGLLTDADIVIAAVPDGAGTAGPIPHPRPPCRTPVVTGDDRSRFRLFSITRFDPRRRRTASPPRCGALRRARPRTLGSSRRCHPEGEPPLTVAATPLSGLLGGGCTLSPRTG